MSKALPPSRFHEVDLQLHKVLIGQSFGRIFDARYADPLGFGKTPSRFSDPRRCADAKRFGVLYLGESLTVCFLETVLRDQRDGAIGDLLLEESALRQRLYAEIGTAEPLKMVDLRDEGAIIMGVPTDVAKASSQTLARKWSAAFHAHPETPDGIIYPSRFSGRTNLAVFDRAIKKLHVTRTMRLIAAPGLAAILNQLKIGIAPT